MYKNDGEIKTVETNVKPVCIKKSEPIFFIRVIDWVETYKSSILVFHPSDKAAMLEGQHTTFIFFLQFLVGTYRKWHVQESPFIENKMSDLMPRPL